MGDCIEGGLKQRSVRAAPPHCPKCKRCVRLTDTLVDVRRSVIVRLYRCECGEIIWDENDQVQDQSANSMLEDPGGKYATRR